MHRWKRLLLWLCLLIILAVGLIYWDSRSAPATVSVTFINYTNRPVTTNLPSGKVYALIVPFSRTAATARLTVKNTGRLSVKLWAVKTSTVSMIGIPTYDDEIYSVDGHSSVIPVPQFLKPGKSLSFEVCVPPRSHSWSAEAQFTPWKLRDRACAWGWATGNMKIRQWTDRLFYRDTKISLATCGPITNQPPLYASLGLDRPEPVPESKRE